MENKNIKVLVLCGGYSTEREVSLRSGQAVCDALKKADFDVDILDLSKNTIHEITEKHPDVVYIALHGKGGEDGQIQGLLEWFGIPYTGPGVIASAICMDKILTKDVLVNRGIKIPEYVVVDKYNVDLFSAEVIEKKFGLPVVIKASCQGSSIGVEIVNDINRVESAINEALSYGDSVLVEQFIKGTELTVPIIGNDELQVLPIIEITSECEFYNYKSKYTPGMSHHIIPARISKEVQEKVKSEAERAYKAVGCRGISRIDFIVDENNIPFVIEINTAPGMTATSLVPDAGKHAGIEFPKLCERIVGYALQK